MRYMRPTLDQIEEWNFRINTYPENVRAIALRFDPWTLYKLRLTNWRVTVHSLYDSERG